MELDKTTNDDDALDEQDQPTGIESLLTQDIELDDEEEPQDDPSDNHAPPAATTPEPAPEPYKPQNEAPEKREFIETELIQTAVNFADKANANICAMVSGSEAQRYINTDKEREKLTRAFKKYLDTSEIKVTPLQSLLGTAALFFGGSWYTAGEDYMKNKKAARIEAERKANEAAAAATADGTPKEATERRRRFDIHASNGCYKFPANKANSNDFIKVDEATEKPSPQVQELIDKGMSSADIRAALGYE